MNNCLNCGKEVNQTPGKKERKYCDDKCKQRHWQKMKSEKKGNVTISREEYEKLLSGNTNVSIGFAYVKDEFIENSKNKIQPIQVQYSKADPNLPGLTRGFKTVKVKQKVKDLSKERLGEKPYKPESKKLSYFEERQQANE